MKPRLAILAILITTNLILSNPIFARDKIIDPEVIIDILTNIQTLQKQNSELLGRVETLEYQIEELKKKFNPQPSVNQNIDKPITTKENIINTESTTKEKTISPSNLAKLDIKNKVDLLNSADNLYRIQAYSAAKEAYQIFLANFPSDEKASTVSINLGYTQKALNEIDAAIASFTQALENTATDSKRLPELLLTTAQLYELNKIDNSAELLYNNLITNFPNSQEANTAKQTLKNRNK